MKFKPFIDEDEVRSIVKRLACEISADYVSKKPVLIGVLKAAFVLMADLSRELGQQYEVDFLQAASYGRSGEPTDEVEIINDIATDIRGKDVIIVEGIVDRGNTARKVVEHLKFKGPSSISICTLLLRNGNSSGLRIDYVGKKIDDGFVVGYGMDYMEGCRGLKGIYVVEKP